MSDEKKCNVPAIEQKNVIDAYNSISDSFDCSRYAPWKTTKMFVNNIPIGSKCLEVGSGNGKNMFRTDIDMYGIDSSEQLVAIAKRKGKNVTVGDACDLKFGDNEFDSVMSIAVLHHVSTGERRKKFIEEIIRVCKVGGSVMVEVWTTTDPKYNKSKTVDGDGKYSVNDRIVTFLSSTDGKKYDRYYHFFDKTEFEELVNSVKHDDKYLEGEVKFEMNNWIFIGSVKNEKS